MNIRRAYRHDILQLTVLFEGYRTFYGMPHEPEKSERFLLDRIAGEESVIFVAEDEERKLRGFTQLYPLFSSVNLQRLWLLNDLFVMEEARGHGTAKLLIDSAKLFASENGSAGLMLETQKINEQANRLYLKQGFTCDNEHNYYYWKPA